MPTQVISDWKNPARTSDVHPAGVGFGELDRDELRQDRNAALDSSGYFCTFTAECNC